MSNDNLFVNTDEKYSFYYKNKKRDIVPFPDLDVQEQAIKKLINIKKESFEEIPKYFQENWDNVKLYHPAGDIEKARSLIINPEDGAYDLKNKLNHMTGKEWTKFTCSWFIFNALQSDLAEEKAITETTAEHPAAYSPTMISEFIKFFTKEGESVFDPFSGIGSTLVACKRTNRIGYGTELNPKYFEVIQKRVPEFSDNIFNDDCRNAKNLYKPNTFSLCISSPPYWDMLNRSTKDFKKKREQADLDYKYSDEDQDIGNIEDYDQFVSELADIYLNVYDLMKKGGHLVIIIKNVKKGGKLYPLAWDIGKALSTKYTLKDEKIWIQDKIGLAPYGYPSSWASNILHHYCIILKKD